MSTTTQTHKLVTEGAIPSQATRLQLNLVGEEHTPHFTEADQGPVRISSVPLSESRGLPLTPPGGHNPPGWPSFRGMPDYVPFEENIDIADRPLGQNGGEFGFLVFMLTGVQIVTVGNKLWRSTVGKVTDEVFKYKIGGHW